MASIWTNTVSLFDDLMNPPQDPNAQARAFLHQLLRPKPPVDAGTIKTRVLLTAEQAEQRGIIRREGTTIHIDHKKYMEFVK